MPADVPAALADLAAAFAALGVRWYVFGAQAVIAAGVPRLTADIDVTVERPRGGPRALIAALARAGIALRPVGDVATFIAETRVIPAIHVASRLPIDVGSRGQVSRRTCWRGPCTDASGAPTFRSSTRPI